MTSKQHNEVCSSLIFLLFHFQGKTTLIKALSEDDSLTPEDRLFATLDVTVHQALLKNLKVLLIDTVGFISNIPSCLMEAFSATLEDALIAVRINKIVYKCCIFYNVDTCTL